MRLLHVAARWDDDEPGARIAALVAACGDRVTHTLVDPGGTAGAALGDAARRPTVRLDAGFPPLGGAPTPGRLQALARAMRGHDLVLAYDWSAIDAALARTLFGEFLALPPLVHHELRRDAAEPTRGLRRRDWYRRIALGRSAAVVAGDPAIAARATGAWQRPAGQVRCIPLGIDPRAYARAPRADALPRVVKRPGERWLGSLAPLPDAEAAPTLVATLGELDERWQLVVAPAAPAIGAVLRDAALQCDLAHRVHLAAAADLAAVAGLFDLVVAWPSATDEPPAGAVLAAMAAGTPLLGSAGGGPAGSGPAGGVLGARVSDENLRMLTAPGDTAGLARAIVALAPDDGALRAIGAANRARAAARFDVRTMVAATRALYAQVLGRAAFP